MLLRGCLRPLICLGWPLRSLGQPLGGLSQPLTGLRGGTDGWTDRRCTDSPCILRGRCPKKETKGKRPGRVKGMVSFEDKRILGQNSGGLGSPTNKCMKKFHRPNYPCSACTSMFSEPQGMASMEGIPPPSFFFFSLFGQRPRRVPEGTKSCRIQGESVRPFVCLFPTRLFTS